MTLSYCDNIFIDNHLDMASDNRLLPICKFKNILILTPPSLSSPEFMEDTHGADTKILEFCILGQFG